MLHMLAAMELSLCSELRRVRYSLPLVLALAVVCLLFADVTLASNIGLGALAWVLAAPTFWAAATATAEAKRRKAAALAFAAVSFGLYAASFVMACKIYQGTKGKIKITIETSEIHAWRYTIWVNQILAAANNLRLVTDACLFWLIARDSAAQQPEQEDRNTTACDGSVPMVEGP